MSFWQEDSSRSDTSKAQFFHLPPTVFSGYQEVLPHFKSVERVSAAIGDASGDAASSAAAFRGRGGAVKVNTLHPPMLGSCQRVGSVRSEGEGEVLHCSEVAGLQLFGMSFVDELAEVVLE